MRPSSPLEFSRAWLGKADDVRRQRAELRAAGELDGATVGELVERGAAMSGTLRIPVIPIRYADVPAPFPVTALSDRLFGGSRGDTVSFRDYWREVSGDLLKVDGAVTSWVSLPRSASHYLSRGEYGWGSFGRIGELRRQVLEQVDPSIDFSHFDNDGPDGIPNSGDDDGYVDFVAFFYVTDCSSDPRRGAIWPHRGAMAPFVTDDRSASGGNVKIADYVILPAQDPGTCGPAHIGVLAHEAAHAFGLPDLYDYDGTSHGVGPWGLMGTGSHSSPHSPAYPSAWAREQLGWGRLNRLARSDTATLSPGDRRILRHDLEDGSGRYLLMERRGPDGSDRDLPGHGLLVWGVDPERGELGAWNADERRPAVTLMGNLNGALVPVDGADDGGPFPGDTGAHAGERFPVRVATEERADSIRVVLTPEAPGRWVDPAVQLATVVGGAVQEHRLDVEHEDSASSWVARSSATWLRLQRDGDAVILAADPAGLGRGVYADTVELLDEGTGQVRDRLPVALEVAGGGTPAVVATDLPWSWGMATAGRDLVQASYGWDALGLRPRPRLLAVGGGTPFPRTLSRIPVEALYAPAAGRNGETYVLGHARGRNYIYRVSPSGDARVVAADVGDEPAYGLTVLPDGSLLMAGFSGRILRVDASGTITRWADVKRAVYQISSDPTGRVYAALLDGGVARIEPGGAITLLETGFERGNLVAVTAAADGRAFAAERGGRGRIVELSEGGPRQLARVADGQFYGLVTDDMFLYALDLGSRQLLRLPIVGPGGSAVASAGPASMGFRSGRPALPALSPPPTPAAAP
ncbi:MAG TPA: M6 family metalloprotease domain-containing protein [Longimicrobiales bacterium]|nr:M6 family metalloprotease domain-containing protein [Longimicrobiales bacterium]